MISYASGFDSSRGTSTGCDYVKAARGVCCAEHRQERADIEVRSAAAGLRGPEAPRLTTRESLSQPLGDDEQYEAFLARALSAVNASEDFERAFGSER